MRRSRRTSSQSRRPRFAGVIVLVALALAGVGASCAPGPCAPFACPPGPPTQLGIFTPLFTGVTDANYVAAEADAVGVRTVRASQRVDSATIRTAFAAFAAKGLQMVFTAVNNQQPDGTGNNPAHPPVTEEEQQTYRDRLGAILDRIPDPTVVQVENEEVAAKFFAGTMVQYRNELDAAIAVAHARGLRVTNGGITTNPLSLLVWQDYKSRGLNAEAEDFASRAFADTGDAWILRDLRKEPFTRLSRQGLQTAWDKAAALVPLLASSDVDYVNFHWYTDDDHALREAIEYLRRATGKPVVTTEIGQHNTSAAVVVGHLGEVVEATHLPLVIWFDWDGDPAKGLHTPGSPGALRPNGEAFKYYVATHQTQIR